MDPDLGGLDVGDDVEVVIEMPRFGFVKPRARGGIDFVSPVPCPYNYGSVTSLDEKAEGRRQSTGAGLSSLDGALAGDGDPFDAIVMGRRLPRGARVAVRVVAIVGFVDAGDDDPKLICVDARSSSSLSARERVGLARFFQIYAIAKRTLHRARGRTGATHFTGFIR